MSFDLGLHVRILEGKGRIYKLAVLHGESLDVAHALKTLDSAVLKDDILGIPSEVLSADIGILHRDVLAVPESILGEHLGVGDGYVAAAVKAVVTYEFEIVDLHVGAVHGKVVALGVNVIEPDVIAGPEGLCGVIHVDILERNIVTSPESLGCFDDHVFHLKVVRIPDTCPCRIEEAAVLKAYILGIPEGILPLEGSIYKFNIAAVLQGRFSVVEDRLFYPLVRYVKEGTLARVKSSL